MRFLRAISLLWLFFGLINLVQTVLDNGLLDPRLLRHGPEPFQLIAAINAIVVLVPALILVAIGHAGARRRRVFSHHRHARHARHNEREVQRARNKVARRDDAARGPGGPYDNVPEWQPGPGALPARPDQAAPPTVASPKPAPRRGSVIERRATRRPVSRPARRRGRARPPVCRP